MPKSPSNLAAMKATPGTFVASAKVWSLTAIPPTLNKKKKILYNKMIKNESDSNAH